jgi:hypothetical protein
MAESKETIMTKKLNAHDELVSILEDGETIEAIVFGAWGWGSAPRDGEGWEPGHGEPSYPPVPFDKRGVILKIEEACPYMEGWSFYGGYGAPACYAVNVWTNKRVMWVTQYDGSTRLSFAPRNPVAVIPDMPGG